MGDENRGWALSPFGVILLYREIGNKTEKWVVKIGRPYLRLFDLFRFVDCVYRSSYIHTYIFQLKKLQIQYKVQT